MPDFKLFEDRESVHEFRVPPRLAALSVTLTAKVKSLSLNQQLDLSAGQSFGLSGVARTDKIEDLHLARFGSDYVIELLGRTGEAKPDRPVTLAVKHRDFKEPVRVTLKTDAARPGHARAARGRRLRHRHRAGGDGAHLAAAARPAHLPAGAAREGRRGGDAAVPRRRGQADARTNWRCSRSAATWSWPTGSTRWPSPTGCSSCAAWRPATTTCG